MAAETTRVKDIPTTATTAAADDYVLLDGATNGTRKGLASNLITTAATAAVAGHDVRFHQTPTGSYDYYVDSVRGSDYWPGTEGAPFQTFSPLQQHLTAGIKIGLARGSYFRDELVLGLGVNGCLIGNYGSGDIPIIDCSDDVPGGSWSKTNGKNYVYQSAISPDLAVADTTVYVWEDAVNLVRVASIDACDATAGTYFPSSDKTAPITLYIHASDDGNPALNHKVYSFSSRRTAVDCIAATHTTIRGIEGRRNLLDSGSFRCGRYTTVIDCIVRDGSKHNIYYQSGSRLERVQAIGAYCTGDATLFVYNDDNPEGEGVTLIDCSAYVPVSASNVAGYYGHASSVDVGTFGHVAYIRCSAENMATGFNGHNATITYLDCKTKNCKRAIMCSTDVEIIGCALESVAGAVGVVKAGRIVRVSNSYTNTTSPNPADVTISANDCTMLIERSRIGGPAGVYRIFENSATGFSLNSQHNIFGAASEQVYYTMHPMSLLSDYNTFQASQKMVIAGTAYATMAAYKTATGQDIHSAILT